MTFAIGSSARHLKPAHAAIVNSLLAIYPLIPLETVAGKTRVMEDHLINAAGNDVTKAFFDSQRPLLGPDMIEVARLRGAKVEKAKLLTGDST